MRNTFLLFACLFFYQSFAQSVSFQKDSSFYPPATRAKMRLISDSLHKNHNFYDSKKQYWAESQAIGHWVTMDTLAQEAYEFLKTQPSFDAFIKKFPFAKVDKNQVVMRTLNNWGDKKEIKFYALPNTPSGHHVAIPFDATIYHGSLKGKWLAEILEAHQYRPNDELEAFFIEKPFEKRVIPNKYVQFIQYVDMLVDTNTNLYLTKNAMMTHDTSSLPYRMALYRLAFPKLNLMFYSNKDMPLGYNCCEDSSYFFIDKISKTKEFIDLLVKASDEAIIKQAPSATLETMTLKYLSPKKVLRLKRLREVNTGCGNDNDPRFHYLSIAQIAGEVGDWNVFMCAHTTLLSYPFDGMRYDKISSVYTSELDSININVPNFLMGAFIKFDDPSNKHFSLSDYYYFTGSKFYTKHYKVIENMLCDAIADKELDDYNRFFCYALFNSFIDFQQNKIPIEKSKKVLLEKQREKVRLTLPSYLASKVKNLENR